MSPVIREMMLYALRWPIGRAESDPVADSFFRTLADLVRIDEARAREQGWIP